MKVSANLFQDNKPDGIPVVFDLQVEAEIIGCKLRWANDSPPCVSSHPLENDQDFTLSVPSSKEGRIPVIMHALRRLKSVYKDVSFFGLITGPLTLATHIMGTELLMNMILEPEKVENLLSFCTEVALRMSEIYAEKRCGYNRHSRSDAFADFSEDISLFSAG